MGHTACLPLFTDLVPLQVKALVQSPAFIRAAYSVVAAHCGLLRELPPMSLQQVAAALRGVAARLAFVDQLHTVVRPAAGGQAALALTSSSPEVSVMRVYEFACRESGRLYIADPPPGLPPSWLLAQALSRELGSPGVTLPLQPFLEAGLCSTEPVGEALQRVVLPGGYDPSLESAGQQSQLGAPLLPSDDGLLSLRPLRRQVKGMAVNCQPSAYHFLTYAPH